ncbi:MAG: hypothetical protein OEX15_11460 [Gammaproteobacteria bacterium]|nr:hypothetical protein [Gammaproteobacteria bacterium]
MEHNNSSRRFEIAVFAALAVLMVVLTVLLFEIGSQAAWVA